MLALYQNSTDRVNARTAALSAAMAAGVTDRLLSVAELLEVFPMTTAPAMTTYPRLHFRLMFAVVALILMTPSVLVAQPLTPKPLPEAVKSQAPGIRALGRGRETVWGIHVYDATLWIVGDRFTPGEPHALDIEPGRRVSADTLVNTAMDEMRRLKLGDASQLASWRVEMKQLMPNVNSGDQVVVFCPNDAKTLMYYNGRSQGAVNDATLCPAIMNVWLHPGSKSSVRKSLLAH